jgi:hypothetical protein
MYKLRPIKKQLVGRLLMSALLLWLSSSVAVLAEEVYGTYSLVDKGGFVVFHKPYNTFASKWDKNEVMYINPTYVLAKKVDKQNSYTARIDYADLPEYLVPRPAVDQNNTQKDKGEAYAVCRLAGSGSFYMFGRQYSFSIPVWRKTLPVVKPVAYKLVKQGEKIRLVHLDRDPDDLQQVYAANNMLISYD